MREKVLLLGTNRERGLALAKNLLTLGFEPQVAAWAGFSPRALGRNRPGLVLADMDQADATPMENLCRLIRKCWGENFPVIAVTAASRFRDLSAHLDAGADDCVSALAPAALLERKLSRCLLTRAVIDAGGDAEEAIPENLLALFEERDGLVPLGELVGVYPGASPRRPAFRRMAPPDEEWRGVVTSEAVERFFAGKPQYYLRWTRLHLFRLPPPAEYAVAEKLLLRRAGPPLAAAVDRSRLPAGTDVYSLVPREGIAAGYVACLLNSRLLDFYFNRLAGIGSDGRLRTDIVKATPVPRPTAAAMQELSRTAALLAHYGPNPQIWIDRQSRDELWEQMENTVLTLYGADRGVREGLSALHF